MQGVDFDPVLHPRGAQELTNSETGRWCSTGVTRHARGVPREGGDYSAQSSVSLLSREREDHSAQSSVSFLLG